MNEYHFKTSHPHTSRRAKLLNHHVMLPTVLLLVVIGIMWLGFSHPNTPTPSSAPLAEEMYDELLPIQPRYDTFTEVEDGPLWQHITVQPGDSLTTLFKRLGLSQQLVLTISRHPTANSLIKKLQAGQTLRVLIDDSGQLLKLIYPLDKDRMLIVSYAGDHYAAQIATRHYEQRLAYASGIIENSFSAAALKAGLNQSQLMQIIEIFQDSLDFKRDIHKGDTFNIVYETYWAENQKIKNGRMLAIEIQSKTRPKTAISFTFPNGDQGYFTPEGESLKRSFLRSPVKYTRISSRFNMNRPHPVLTNVVRPHTGVDLAAPRNTPIYATSDGKIQFIGRRGGYGRAVIIDHGKGYTTLYGHMAGFADKLVEGSRVRKGQLIGYVGSSGLATGPHVHYEFRMNNTPKDPLKVRFPKAESVPNQHRYTFNEQKNGLLELLTQYKSTLASQRNNSQT